MIRRPPRSTLFPYTTSSDLARSRGGSRARTKTPRPSARRPTCAGCRCSTPKGDRKSTRLNSSHTVISYAVFCLKKKKTKQQTFIHLVDTHQPAILLLPIHSL